MIRDSYKEGFRAAFKKFALSPPTQVDEFMAKVDSGKEIPVDHATDAPAAPNLPQDPSAGLGAPNGALPSS